MTWPRGGGDTKWVEMKAFGTARRPSQFDKQNLGSDLSYGYGVYWYENCLLGT